MITGKTKVICDGPERAERQTESDMTLMATVSCTVSLYLYACYL